MTHITKYKFAGFSKTILLNVLVTLTAMLGVLSDQPWMTEDILKFILLGQGLLNVIIRTFTSQPITFKAERANKPMLLWAGGLIFVSALTIPVACANAQTICVNGRCYSPSYPVYQPMYQAPVYQPTTYLVAPARPVTQTLAVRGTILERLTLRSILSKQSRTNPEATIVLRDRDLFDALYESLKDEHSSLVASGQVSGRLTDFLEWAIEHQEEISAFISMIIKLFGDTTNATTATTLYSSTTTDAPVAVTYEYVSTSYTSRDYYGYNNNSAVVGRPILNRAAQRYNHFRGRIRNFVRDRYTGGWLNQRLRGCR